MTSLAALAVAFALANEGDRASLDALLVRADAEAIHREPAWRKLVHYRQKLWGRRSQADARSFFAHPHGKIRPEAELRATLEALFQPATYVLGDPADPSAQHPQCRWRARTAWLRDRLDIDDATLPPVPCDRFDDWVERLDVDRVTLIYADAYLGNPASMFGHTFLRLDRDTEKPGSALVANAAEFSATPWTTNPLLYPILGLAGGFPGRYSTLPYYMKVRQYGDAENRDLWEYELTLTDAERTNLLEVMWEMGGVHFDYYYLKENCSYHLLGLFEAVRPSLELQDRFPIVAFPTSTVRAIRESPDLSGPGVWRPSAWTRLVAARRTLDRDEVRTVRDLALGRQGPGDVALAPDRAAAILDAASLLASWRLGDDAPTPEDRERQRTLLAARGALAIPSPEVDVEPTVAPERGHGPALLSMAGGASESGPYARLVLRPALHDFLARTDGYIAGSELEMMGVTARFDPEPAIERLGIFSATSLSPWDPWRRVPSWRMRIGGGWDRTGGCATAGCWRWAAMGGIGLAAATPDRADAVAWALVTGTVATGAGSSDLSPGGLIGLSTGAGPLRTTAELSTQWPVLSIAGIDLSAAWRHEISVGASYTFHPDAEFRLAGRAGTLFREAEAGVAVWF